MPVDCRFRSLAEDVGPSAIGVVLSGTGADGAPGLKAIKAADGFPFVQDPQTARYDGMPRSALHAGAADCCLPPKDELERPGARTALITMRSGGGPGIATILERR